MMVIPTIQQIFQKRFGMHIGEDAFGDNLERSVTIRLRSFEWLYLVKDVETAFGIEIDQKSIETGRIRSLKGLIETIEDLVNGGKTQRDRVS